MIDSKDCQPESTQAERLKQRTKQFALLVIRLVRRFPRTEDARILGRQFLRSATSAAANYRAACRARSHREFLARIGIVVEEMDETVFWFELLTEAEIVSPDDLAQAYAEAKELLAIFAASQRTARRTRTASRLVAAPIKQ